MPKRHMSGFVPIPFRTAGKVILALSGILIAIGGIGRLTAPATMPLVVLYIGIGLLLIGMYLLFAPKE